MAIKTLKFHLEDYPKGARQLIVVAEKLFGQQGIDNVSLRQIVVAADQANNYAVQHHFGSKEGLIEAIFTLRMVQLDKVRAELLNEIKESGDISVERIVSAILLSILDAFNEKERYIYAEFIFQVFHREKTQNNRIITGDTPSYHEYLPAVNELNTLLREELAHLPLGVVNTRYRLAAELFLSGLFERRHVPVDGSESYPNDDIFWKDILGLAIMVFKAPYSNS